MSRIPLLAAHPLDRATTFRLPLSQGITPRRFRGSPTPTFVRSSTGYYVNGAGGISQAAIDTARISYDEGRPGLLIEPTGTNYCLHSQEFDNAAWTKDRSGTAAAPIITANAGVAPDGSMTADRAQFDVSAGATADYSRLIQIVSGFSNPHPSSDSIWVKANSGGPYVFTLGGGGTTSGGSIKSITVTSNWQRFSVAASSVADTTDHLQLRLRQSESTSNTADVLIWGGQVEASPRPTSYRAVGLSPSFHAADSLSYPAAGNLSARAFTVSVWAYNVVPPSGAYRGMIAVGTVNGANSLKFANLNSTIYAQVFGASGNVLFRTNTFPDTSSGFVNLIFTFDCISATGALYVNGVLQSPTITNSSYAPVSAWGSGNLYVGCDSSGEQLDGLIADPWLIGRMISPGEAVAIYSQGPRA